MVNFTFFTITVIFLQLAYFPENIPDYTSFPELVPRKNLQGLLV